MQQIYKVLFLYSHLIYKIIVILINSTITCILLSSCNTLLQNQTEYFLLQKNETKQNDTKKFSIKIHQEKNLQDIKQYHHIIQKKEQIISLLDKSGVNLKDILKLIKKDKSILNNLKNGQHLSWKVNKSGTLIELIWKISNFQKKIYRQHKRQFLSNIYSKNFLLCKTIFIKKHSTFFRSALQSGLNQSEINSIIKALQWQVDFHKLNIGSNFNLIFSHNLMNNKNILLGVKLNNSGKKYYSIRASNGNFYDINGYNKKNYFINFAFLNKYRISSEFNLHRLNPVTHRVARHLGVDFAMPQGTPVLATTNGKIIQACFNKIAGFYVVLKNKNHFVTRYMHLKKILVKTGDIVKIGEKIALSGNTGRTTGPHLHYEIWINNHAVNPMKIILKYSGTLTEKEKKDYLKESKEILKYLN